MHESSRETPGGGLAGHFRRSAGAGGTSGVRAYSAPRRQFRETDRVSGIVRSAWTQDLLRWPPTRFESQVHPVAMTRARQTAFIFSRPTVPTK